MKWFWCNTTQVGFGQGAVREHLSKFIAPNSRVLCTFGFGSIDKNGARSDVQSALDALSCEVRWEGGIPANPEYDRLVEIASVARSFKPALLLAVGGGSVLDGTKFIGLAAGLDAGLDPWEIMTHHKFSGTPLPIASVITLPATGSEWNEGFVISRRAISQKRPAFYPEFTFPKFSLIDPLYTLTLPARQLRNGVYDAITHCLDGYLTPISVPLLDHFSMAVVKELVTIGPDVVREGSSLELHERLIVAASFALNGFFMLGKPACGGIHMIGHQLTAKYGIDHGATLAICTKSCLESQFDARKAGFAESAGVVFGVWDGTVEERANAFIEKLQEFIVAIGLPTRVSDWEGVVVGDGDVEEILQGILTTVGAPAVGFEGCYKEDDIRRILTKVVV